MSPPPVSLPDVRRRALAAFLGLALGDALGAPVEFMTRGEIQATHGVLRELVGGGWLHLRRGAVTDDTEMSLCLAQSIVARGGLDSADAAETFAGWLRAGPADVGNTVRRGIRRYLLDGSLSGPPLAGDGGNGAAMRMVPVALATLADREGMAAAALAQAHLTPPSPTPPACTWVTSSTSPAWAARAPSSGAAPTAGWRGSPPSGSIPTPGSRPATWSTPSRPRSTSSSPP